MQTTRSCFLSRISIASAAVNLLLLCFELISSLKISFHKCEVVYMGLDIAEGRRVADLLNCKLPNFPISYLGLPVSTKNISIEESGTFMC